MDKKCGTCTLCCYFQTIPEFGKVEGKYCRHCLVGEGCKIYDVRPPSCRGFKCLWLAEAQVPDHFRPDICHVMIELPIKGGMSFMAYLEPNYPDAWKERNFRILVQKILNLGKPVVLYRGKGIPNHFFLPHGISEYEVTRDLFRMHALSLGN